MRIVINNALETEKIIINSLKDFFETKKKPPGGGF